MNIRILQQLQNIFAIIVLQNLPIKDNDRTMDMRYLSSYDIDRIKKSIILQPLSLETSAKHEAESSKRVR